MGVTFGIPSPGQITQNLDTVLTLAFANAGTQIFDQISKNNAIFYEIKKNGMYEGIDPEPYLEVPLMYGTGSAEWYEGWDVLGTTPTEGVTAAVYQWRQLACPAGYNRREARVTNKQRIKDIVKLKIEQAQMAMTETFNRAFLQGNLLAAGGNVYTPTTSPTTGRSGIDPIGELVFYKSGLSHGRPSDSLAVGGLDQATYDWWRNWSHDGTGVTTYMAFLRMFDEMYENCSKGVGGSPDLIITDSTTRANLRAAYYQVYRRDMDSQNDYPFDNVKFRGAKVIVDELVPNVHSGSTDTSLGSGLGTAYFLNTKFMKIRYDKEANFILTDMQKPVNQDGKVGHVLWMGNTVLTNRRKHGVIGDIQRTLTVS